MTKFLKNERLVKPIVPELPSDNTAHEKRVEEYHMGELMKTKRVLEGNLCELFAVLISLCDSDTKTQVESGAKLPDLEKKLAYMGLLDVIK